MVRLALHVLLIVTLILNGGAVPWAMAAAHAGSGHTHHAHPSASHVSATAVDNAHADHHSAMTSANGTANPEDSKGGGSGGACCDPGACQCGCVLPPLLLVARMQLSPQTVAIAPSVAIAHALIVRRSNPPFRPPAV